MERRHGVVMSFCHVKQPVRTCRQTFFQNCNYDFESPRSTNGAPA